MFYFIYILFPIYLFVRYITLSYDGSYSEGQTTRTTIKNIFNSMLLAGLFAIAAPFATAMDHIADINLMEQSEAAATAEQHEAAGMAFTVKAGQLRAAAKTQERIANRHSGRISPRMRPAKFVDTSLLNTTIAERLRCQSQQSLLMAVNHLRKAEEMKLVD